MAILDDVEKNKAQLEALRKRDNLKHAREVLATKKLVAKQEKEFKEKSKPLLDEILKLLKELHAKIEGPSYKYYEYSFSSIYSRHGGTGEQKDSGLWLHSEHWETVNHMPRTFRKYFIAEFYVPKHGFKIQLSLNEHGNQNPLYFFMRSDGSGRYQYREVKSLREQIVRFLTHGF